MTVRLATFGADLLATQESAVRSRDAGTFDVIGDAIRGMTQRAGETEELVIKTGARLMLANPWRITRAVYGPFVTQMWPAQEIGPTGIQDRAAVDVLADCRRMLADERSRGSAGHWTHDFNRLIALRQAERALAAIVAGGAI